MTLVVRTKPCYWNQCNIYLRQDFFNKDTGLLHCVIYVRFGLVQNGKLVQEMEDKQGGFHQIKWYADSNGFNNDYQCRNEMDETLKAWVTHQSEMSEPTISAKL